MTQVPDHADETAVDQWLVSKNSSLLAGLAKVLDVEAGVEDAQAGARAMSLNFNVGPPLDVEAGLRAVLPPTSTELVPLPAFEIGRPLHAYAQELLRSSSQVRLTARRELPLEEIGQAGSAALALSLALARSRRFGPRLSWRGALWDIDQNYSWEKDYELKRILLEAKRFQEKLSEHRSSKVGTDDPFTPKNWLSKNVVKPSLPVTREIETRLIHVLMEALTVLLDRVVTRREILVEDLHRTGVASSGAGPSQMLDIALEITRSALHDFRLAGSRISDQEDLTDFLLELAEDMQDIETAGLNFTGADLRDVDLGEVTLDGIRWSTKTTLWPAEWNDYVQSASVRIDPIRRPHLREVRFGQRVPSDSHAGSPWRR